MRTYDMPERHQIPAESPPPKDTSKIYFFVFAIAALLVTNIYFYFKYKNSDARIVVLSDDKVRVNAEIDRVEANLNLVNSSGIELTESLKMEEDNARAMIANLRAKLSGNELTQEEINKSWQAVKALQLIVSKHTSELLSLKQKNIQMAIERDSLLNTVKDTRGKVKELEGQKSALQSKVKVASALKVSALSVSGVHARNNGRETIETRARRTDRFKLSFTIAENQLAHTGNYDIYIRIIDPNGNLIIDENNLFQVGGEDMQYTFKTGIDFLNDGKLYTFSWTPRDGIKRGTYTFVLYSNGFLMGRASISLK